jgi:hypothetical protein
MGLQRIWRWLFPPKAIQRLTATNQGNEPTYAVALKVKLFDGGFRVLEAETGKPFVYTGNEATQWVLMLNPNTGTADLLTKIQNVPLEQ